MGIIKQAKMKEKNLKSVSQENKKTNGNQTISEKSHQRNKHLDCPPCKIHRTILKADEGRTSTNGPKNQKTHDDA